MEVSKGVKSLDIRVKTGVFFGAMIALLVANYCLITYANANLRKDGAKVEIARRNLNLINESSFRAAAIMQGHTVFAEPLREHIKEVDQYTALLLNGGEIEIRETAVQIEPAAEAVRPQLENFSAKWDRYKKQLETIVAAAVAEESGSEAAAASLKFVYRENGPMFSSVLKLCDQTIDAYISTQTRIHLIIFALTILNIAGMVFGYFFIRKTLIYPVLTIRKAADKLADGDLDARVGIKRNDEVGKLSAAINKVIDSIAANAGFARQIGDGDFSSDFRVAGEKDKLGLALLTMRDNLKKVAEEDKIRYWSNEGMARFGEILRNDHGNLKELSFEIISQLVKYVEVNQGALFTREDKDGEEVLEMQACYAYERQKFIKKTIGKGEGLAGQAMLEQDTIYITEVPDSFANITSGLGGSRPRSVLIIPLKVNDEIYGVVEIASLKEIPKYKIEFVEKISENIASSLSSSRVNEQTKKLLNESQELTEQMQAQEEEMRQNMEELQATQEEMGRKQRDLAKNEELFRQITDNVPGVIYQFALDPASGKGGFTYASKASLQLLGINAEELVNASDFRQVLVVHEEDAGAFQSKLQQSAGSMSFFSWDGRIRKASGEYVWVNASSSPERQQDGSILWSGIITDISKRKELESQLQKA